MILKTSYLRGRWVYHSFAKLKLEAVESFMKSNIHKSILRVSSAYEINHKADFIKIFYFSDLFIVNIDIYKRAMMALKSLTCI
jgi:hypothetical protein